jgi:hypothetical protein
LHHLPTTRNPVAPFEDARSAASSPSVAQSAVLGGSRSRPGIGRRNSNSLPGSPLHSLTKSSSRDEESDDDEEDEDDDDPRGDGAGAAEGRDGKAAAGGGGATWGDHVDDDDDDLSDGDDEAGLRRYHFTQARTLPSEFDGRHHASAWKRAVAYLLELRMAARQRRAHRLLSMSGTHMDSPAQRCRLCFMTHCWDATDRSILLLIVAVFLWMVLGFVLHPGKDWWYVGIAALVVRLAARPAVEAIGSIRRQPFRSSSSSGASRAMPSISGFGRIASSAVVTADSLEMGSSSHNRSSLGRQARSRSPTPKSMTMV